MSPQMVNVSLPPSHGVPHHASLCSMQEPWLCCFSLARKPHPDPTVMVAGTRERPQWVMGRNFLWPLHRFLPFPREQNQRGLNSADI